MRKVVDVPLVEHLVYDNLFIYDANYPKVHRSLQVFTRDMEIAFARILMSRG